MWILGLKGLSQTSVRLAENLAAARIVVGFVRARCPTQLNVKIIPPRRSPVRDVQGLLTLLITQE